MADKLERCHERRRTSGDCRPQSQCRALLRIPRSGVVYDTHKDVRGSDNTVRFERFLSCDTDLVHSWLDFSGSKQCLEFLFVKVADTNAPICFVSKESRGYRKSTPCQTSFVDLFHLAPSCWDIGNSETWRMNEVQVNIRYPKL